MEHIARPICPGKKKFQPSGSGALSPKKHWKFTELMRFLDDIPASNEKTIGNYKRDTQHDTQRDTQNCKALDDQSFNDLFEVDLGDEENEYILPSQDTLIPSPSYHETQTLSSSYPNATHQGKNKRLLEDERNANIDNAHKEMTEVLKMVKESFQGPSNSLNLFFTSASIQVQEANLPVSSQAFIKSEVSRIIMDEIKKHNTLRP